MSRFMRSKEQVEAGEVDQLTSRLEVLRHKKEELLAEEAHVQAELVRKLRLELLQKGLELEQTKQKFARANEELELLAPVVQGLRRLRRDAKPSDDVDSVFRRVPAEQLMQAAITFGRAPPEDIMAVVGRLPAVRLAHALMETVAEHLAAQRVADGVRDEVTLMREDAAPLTSAAAESHAEDPIQAPSVDVVGALLEHAGGWRGAARLEQVSSSWQDAVRGWRRYEQRVSLVSKEGVTTPPRYGFVAARAIAVACPNLVELEILGRREAQSHDRAEVNDVACELLVNGCPKLRRLVLRDCAALTSDCLPQLSRLECLETLDLAGCDGIFTDGGREGSSHISRSAAIVAHVSQMALLSKFVVYGCTPLAEADEEALVQLNVLDRASCGCHHCAGFASAQIRLRLALMAATAGGLEQSLAL